MNRKAILLRAVWNFRIEATPLMALGISAGAALTPAERPSLCRC